MGNNWITIWDNTAEARIVYVSESITRLAGWEPEDIIGREGFELFHPGDCDSLHKVRLTNVYNEKMSSMVSYRYRKKDGTYIKVETIIHYCHDVLIGSNFLYDENSLEHRARANTVDEMFICQPDGTLEVAGSWNNPNTKQKPALDKNNIWKDSRLILSQERRFCLILNRFSPDLNIVFASKMATELVSLDVEKALGNPFFDYVKEEDVEDLDSQIDVAREVNMVVRLRFDWVIDRENNISEPVEAIVSGTDDGIIMVTRLAPRMFLDAHNLKS